MTTLISAALAALAMYAALLSPAVAQVRQHDGSLVFNAADGIPRVLSPRTEWVRNGEYVSVTITFSGRAYEWRVECGVRGRVHELQPDGTERTFDYRAPSLGSQVWPIACQSDEEHAANTRFWARRVWEMDVQRRQREQSERRTTTRCYATRDVFGTPVQQCETVTQ